MAKHDYHESNIFHEEALERLNYVDDAPVALSINQTYMGYWLAIIIFLVAILLIWMVFWKVESTVSAPGVILKSSDIIFNHNRIMENSALLSDKVKSLEVALHNKQNLFDHNNLTMDDLIATKSAYIQAKNELFDVVAISNVDLAVLIDKKYALVFVHWQQGSRLHVGMKVNLRVTAVTKDQSQYTHGRIIKVSARPLSVKLATAYLGGLNLANNANSDEPVYMALIEPDASAYLSPWTSVDAKIILDTFSPLQVLRSKLFI